jgi:hypothetical protein
VDRRRRARDIVFILGHDSFPMILAHCLPDTEKPEISI